MARTYLAWLDPATSKVPKSILPAFTANEVGAIPASTLGAVYGVAQLGADKRLLPAQLPTSGLVSVDAFNALASQVSALTVQVSDLTAQVQALTGTGGPGPGAGTYTANYAATY